MSFEGKHTKTEGLAVPTTLELLVYFVIISPEHLDESNETACEKCLPQHDKNNHSSCIVGT